MTDDHNQPEANLTPDVAAALQAAFRHGPHVPAEVDDAILNLARHELAARRRFRPWTAGWRAGAGLAAAAGLALAVWTMLPRWMSPTRSVAIQDVDRDGRVDIVDALRLARAIDAGSTGRSGDINGDGRIDRADVDAIAGAAVRLDGGAL